ncbi:hypothetical protein VHEMI01340 [[Torrubiella] hemipterigena]|uniref:Peptidase S53 domain-containing protein n=1 Tax=[Torrubiella] hemipterigena TaxID=1531966 RepID=A0A0A1SSV6_9HYPO|nr:hypothetical protein VHEMI01340 [[Torrubiella] hemipterigena]
MQFAALFVSAFVAAALGMPAGHVQHESHEAHPSIIKRAGAALDKVVPVRIALKQSNLDNGMDMLMEVSDPESAKYGQHYTQEEVSKAFAPEQKSVDAVKKWLVEAGIPADSIKAPASQGWLQFQTTVDKLETLLHTKYNVFEDRDSSEHFLGTEAYHLPAEVAEHVDFVTPAVAMYKVKNTGRAVRSPATTSTVSKRAVGDDPLSGCDESMTPECIKTMYNIADAKQSPNPANRLGMFEMGSFINQDDLNGFYTNFANYIPQGFGPKIDFIAYRGDPSPGGSAEPALDFDVAYPIIYPQNIELYQVRNTNNDLLDHFLDAIDGSFCTTDGGDDPNIDGPDDPSSCGKFKPTNVISVSYGGPESKWPIKYVKRQCNEFMKLGLQGTSVLFASGDGGVAGPHGKSCSGDGKVFTASATSGCPYITSVGATELPSGSSPGDAEQVPTHFAPGGGFSNFYPRPDYQRSAVESFLTNHKLNFKGYNNTDGSVPSSSKNGVFNQAGRGYPDIAVVGAHGAIFFQGEVKHTGGTSMAAPIMASMFNLINEDRLAAGKKPLGFLNPAIYKNPSMFTDVTLGGMLKTPAGSCDGNSFDAVTGWDPASGLGTPQYPVMAKYFTGLP